MYKNVYRCMVKRVSGRKGLSTPSSSREVCSCTAGEGFSATLHEPDCCYYSRVDLNRTKLPEHPLPEVKLRRPDGLWPNALNFDVDEMSTEEQMELISSNIDRYLSLGDASSALYWIDLDYAKNVQSGSKFVAMAEYVKNLSRAREWDRLLTFLESHHLYQLHLYFAYYYVTALFNMKMFNAILQAQIGHLVNLESGDLNFNPDTRLPLRKPSLPVKLLRHDQCQMSEEDIKILDDKCTKLMLLAALLFILGKTYLATENRHAAQNFLWAAWLRDKSNMEVEELITRFNFPDGKRRQAQWDKFTDRRTHLSPSNDPRSILTFAKKQYDGGNVNAAYNYTALIMKEHGLYRPALLLHLAGAVAMKEADSLFLLAHQLVDRNPQDAMTWYAVAMYYFVIGNNGAAKNFINKATMMNRAFGEAWVAFGHILSSENDHEQALNCYLKALRILDRHHELNVFLAMEYCRSKNTKLAMDFLKDPQLYPASSDITKGNPYREHEQGCVHYSQKHYKPALASYSRALRAINSEVIRKTGKYSRDQIMMLDRFWEPLIGNMAHCHRRLGEYQKAVVLYECSLVMSPCRESTLIGLGVCFACLGDVTRATLQFHRALALNPYNTMARQALDRLVQYSADCDLFTAPVPLDDSLEVEPSASLESILNDINSAEQDAAQKVAMRAMGNRSSHTKRFVTSSVKRPAHLKENSLTRVSSAVNEHSLLALDLSPILPETGDVIVDGEHNEPMDTL